jgi:hypothetical protein
LAPTGHCSRRPSAGTPPPTGPNRRRLRAARFDAWLAKPLDLDALGDALETALSPARHAGALDAEASDGA